MDVILDYWMRFGINLAIVIVLVFVLYCRCKPNRNYAIAMIIGGALVYVLILLMVQVEIGLGVGFGIFAIFSLLRFRTVTISLRDMAYLFAAIALSLVNALLLHFGKWEELFAVNVALLGAFGVLESRYFQRCRASFVLVYDKLDLLKPANRAALLQDISQRTGIQPVDVVINSVNLKRGRAELLVIYFEEDQKAKEKPGSLHGAS